MDEYIRIIKYYPNKVNKKGVVVLIFDGRLLVVEAIKVDVLVVQNGVFVVVVVLDLVVDGRIIMINGGNGFDNTPSQTINNTITLTSCNRIIFNQ